MEMKCPPRGREKSIVNALLTHSEHPNYADKNNSIELFDACKRTLKEIEAPGEVKCLWFFSNGNNFHQDKKVLLLGTGTKFPATVVFGVALVSSEGGVHHGSSIFSHGLRVNADANGDAYVKTPQIIVVKMPWIDIVVNGGRPYVFQRDSALFHEALKGQN
ncbi:hypothetical protein ACTXT7_011339 [Hymenolepis weldensis]